LDDERAAIAWHDVERTADELGADGPAWRATLGTLARHQDLVVELALGDKRSVPPALLTPRTALAAPLFAALTAVQGTPAWNLPFRTCRARALLAGVAAHAIGHLPSTAMAATSALLGTIAHGEGWPLPRGGSQAIVDVMVGHVRPQRADLNRAPRARARACAAPARRAAVDPAAR